MRIQEFPVTAGKVAMVTGKASSLELSVR